MTTINMHEKDCVLNSSDEWITWLSLQEEQRISIYLLSPDELIAAYRREKQIARDYQGREILELLQNANDAAAEINIKGKVKLILFQDALIIANTGKPFTIGGVQSLRISDLSPKRKKKYLIGNKGLGFRSVLNWSRKPLILSGALSLTYSEQKNADISKVLNSRNLFLKSITKEEKSRADEIILPALAFPAFVCKEHSHQLYDLCDDLRRQGYDTVIGMPFDSLASFDDAKKEISLLKPETLLFIDNIDELSLTLPDQKEIVWKIIDSNEHTKNVCVFTGDLKEPPAPHRWHISKKSGKVPSQYLDEHIDAIHEYEIVIAVPEKKEYLPEAMPLFSYFPTEVVFPYPVVCHATLELETNRKHPQESNLNAFIFKEIAALLARVAERQTNPTDPWCKARILTRTRDNDPLMNRFGFTQHLLAEARQKRIIPTLSQHHKRTEDVKFIDAKNLSWLPVKSFGDVVQSVADGHIRKLMTELAIDEMPDSVFRHRLNALKFADIDSRARLITGLITNDCVPSDPPPELLLDEAGNIISHESRVYLSPMEAAKKYETPEWLNIRFVASDLRAHLAIHLRTTDQRELRQKLAPFNVNEYALANIASAIIAEVRRRIAGEPEKTKLYIQETLISLFLMFPEDEEPPKLADTAKMPLLDKKGSFTDARSLYFSATYASNGNLLEELYGHSCPEKLIARPEEYDLGFKGDNPIWNRFFKWLGVADLPRENYVERVENSYLEYVLESLTYPCNFKEYIAESRKDIKRPRLEKVKSIDHIEDILKSDAAAILTWLAIDYRVPAWRNQDTSYAILSDRRGYDINDREYKGVLSSYTHWKIKNTEWLPIRDDKKAKPGLCMYGERALEKVLPMPADFQHHLFEEYHIDRLKLRNAWDNAGVLPGISYLTPKQIIDILLELPTVDPEGKSARVLYRNILENVELDRNDWKEPVKIFKEKGWMWGKGPDGHKYFRVNELRHADTDDIPEQLSNKINFVDLPKRVGAQKVQNIFGVVPIDRRKIEIEIRDFQKIPQHNNIQYLFQICKPYLYALRQVKTKQYQEISSFKKLELVLCKEINITLTYEKNTLELPLTEPYQWILKDDQAFVLGDPQEEASFRSDIFVDSIGSVIASVLHLESGGDFARILRCESNSDRIKLLKRIVGETSLPDIEELKKEFTQVERQPFIVYPPKQETTQESKTTEPSIEKGEEKTVGDEEQPDSSEMSTKEMIVTKTDHTPAGTDGKKIIVRKANTSTHSLTTFRRVTDGDICERKVLTFEESEGRWPIRVSHIQGYEGPGCDIVSFGNENDWQEYQINPVAGSLLIKRFIEVKGRSSEKGAISLKGNELNAARTYADQYYLYRLYEKNNNENILLILNNPLEQKEAMENIIEVDLLRAIKTEKYQLTFEETQDSIKNATNSNQKSRIESA